MTHKDKSPFFLLFAIVATGSCDGTNSLQVEQQPKFKICHSLGSEYHVEKKQSKKRGVGFLKKKLRIQ